MCKLRSPCRPLVTTRPMQRVFNIHQHLTINNHNRIATEISYIYDKFTLLIIII